MDYYINVLQTIGEDFFYSSEDKEVFEVIDDFIYYLIDAISKSSDIEERERFLTSLESTGCLFKRNTSFPT